MYKRDNQIIYTRIVFHCNVSLPEGTDAWDCDEVHGGIRKMKEWLPLGLPSGYVKIAIENGHL